MAVTPMPLGAAVDQKFFADFKSAALEDVVPDGEKRFGDGGGFDEGERFRLLDAAQLGSDGIFGVAAAAEQRQDFVAARNAARRLRALQSRPILRGPEAPSDLWAEDTSPVAATRRDGSRRLLRL